MTRAKDISKILTDADLSGTLDVTGAVTASDITVNGSAVTSLTLNTSVNGSQILFNDGTSGTQPWQVGIRNNGSNDFLIYQSGPENIDIFTDNKLRQTIGSGGDISFYEDTGTTPKFIWDSSAESLTVDGVVTVDRVINATTSSDPWLKGVNGSNTETFFLKPSGQAYFGGNVGIGHTSTGGANFAICDGANSAIQFFPEISTDTNLIQHYDQTATAYMNSEHRANSHIFKTGTTERMRITSAGAMTMGTTSSQTAVSGITLKNDVQSGYPTLLFLQNQPGTGGTMGADIHMGYASDYGSILRFYGNPFSKRQGGFEFRRVTGSGTSDLSMRINDDGNVGIGDSSNIARLMVESNFTAYTGINVKNNHSVASGVFINFTNSSGTQAGSISHNGTTTVAYNTSSDHRLKENVTEDWDATTRLKQLNPVRFNFIADADTTVDGFLAHEVQSVVPEAITGTHNEVDDDGNPVYQGIDQSKLVPLLVKTIQELEARIVALETA